MFIKKLKNDNSLHNGYEPKYSFHHVKDSFCVTKANPCNINIIFHMHLFVYPTLHDIYWLRLAKQEKILKITKPHKIRKT
jgi:hypothetical protein